MQITKCTRASVIIINNNSKKKNSIKRELGHTDNL